MKIGKLLRDAINKVAKHAPNLAKVVLGSRGEAALDLLRNVFGLPAADDDELAKAILEADPEKFLQLERMDHEWRSLLVEMDVQDRASARQLAATKGTIPHVVLSAIVIVMFGWIAFEFFDALFRGSEKLNSDLLALFGTVFGLLAAIVTQVFNFWFGSSNGSVRKTDQIFELKNGR